MKKYLFATILAAASIPAGAITLDEYLYTVKSNNLNYKSADILTEASGDKRLAGDISLLPTLTLKGTQSVDQTQPATYGTKRAVNEYSLGLAQRFSTGTSASLTGKVNDYKIDGVTAPLDKFATSNLSLGLSQSLWKDSFGHGTRLRRTRELQIYSLEKTNLGLQQIQLLVDAESAYWDYVLAKQNLILQKENLERAKKIEGWVRRRAANGIADQADVLNANALTALNEYQLTAAQDELLVQQQKSLEFLSESGNEAPKFDSSISKSRGLAFDPAKKNVIRLDYYMNYLDAEVKKTMAEETKDSFRPDLVLEGFYSTNSFEPTQGDALKKISDSKTPSTSVSLKFVYMFDTDIKKAAVSSAQQSSLAASLKADRSLFESRNAVSEFQRRYNIMTSQVAAAEKLASIQRRRAKAESDRYSRGRSITSTVVTAEQEAAQAEVNMMKLQVEQRKMEARSKLFVEFEEGTTQL